MPTGIFNPLAVNICKLVKGFMIESYIKDGAQKIDEHIYGKSITDPCLTKCCQKRNNNR